MIDYRYPSSWVHMLESNVAIDAQLIFGVWSIRTYFNTNMYVRNTRETIYPSLLVMQVLKY